MAGIPSPGLRDGDPHPQPRLFRAGHGHGDRFAGGSLGRSARLSGTLLALTIACYAVLVVAYGWRLAGYRREFMADLIDPRKTFASFTFVAASDVLGSRLAADGHSRATIGLLIVASLAWLLLNYVIPMMLITRHGTQSALAGANGTWFIWVVGTQSLAVSATVLPPLAQDRSPVLS